MQGQDLHVAHAAVLEVCSSPSCHRHMKAALHALEQLNALAWQQSLHEGNRPIPPHDKLKMSAFDELQSSLSMPDQISADLARPLIASVVDEVHLMTENKPSRLSMLCLCAHDCCQKEKQHHGRRSMPDSCHLMCFLQSCWLFFSSSCRYSCMSDRSKSHDTFAGYLSWCMPKSAMLCM